MKHLLILLALVSMLGSAFAQDEPAAKVHVRQVGNSYVKYTSKLTGVVELNFTMGFHHNQGKGPTTAALEAAGTEYGFTVHKITGAGNGATVNDIPNFGLSDLVDNGQVIVANNISFFGNTALGSARQSAIQQAIETRGMGYLGNHGSGDNNKSHWPWFSNSLYPVGYAGHGSRDGAAPVYKNSSVAEHVALEGVLETVAANASVPDELDGSGNEKLSNLKTRSMRMEWYRYNNIDFCPDGASKQECLDRLTVLLKYDARNVSSNILADKYKRKGGNIFTYIFKVGQGLTSYLPVGHFQREFDDFDEGVNGNTASGDTKRYLGQLLMYLAGYNLSVCNDENPCIGLPIVDGNGIISGDTVEAGSNTSAYLPKSIQYTFDAGNVGFTSRVNGDYKIQLVDLAGNVLDETQGIGAVRYSYASDKLAKGVYFLRVQYKGQTPQIKRYAILNN